MYWKRPPSAGKYQVAFGSDPRDEVHVDTCPQGVTRALNSYGSCDMNALHWQEPADPKAAPDLQKTLNGATYHLHRSEVLRDMVNHVYLRDEGDDPPASVKNAQMFATAIATGDLISASAISDKSAQDNNALQAEAKTINAAVAADIVAQAAAAPKGIVSKVLTAIGLGG